MNERRADFDRFVADSNCPNGGSAQDELGSGGGAKGKGFSFSESGAGSAGGPVKGQGLSSSH
jgi:hypothetical protein